MATAIEPRHTDKRGRAGRGARLAGAMGSGDQTSCGVALGTTVPAQWKEMGAAIVAGVEAGWVNPVVNKVVK